MSAGNHAAVARPPGVAAGHPGDHRDAGVDTTGEGAPHRDARRESGAPRSGPQGGRGKGPLARARRGLGVRLSVRRCGDHRWRRHGRARAARRRSSGRHARDPGRRGRAHRGDGGRNECPAARCRDRRRAGRPLSVDGQRSAQRACPSRRHDGRGRHRGPGCGLAHHADRRSVGQRNRHGRRRQPRGGDRPLARDREGRRRRRRWPRASLRCSSIPHDFGDAASASCSPAGTSIPECSRRSCCGGSCAVAGSLALRVEISDVPGALGKVSSIVGEVGGNIVDVAHQRLFSDVSIKSAILELAVETRDRVHANELIAALDRGGFPTELLGRRSATIRRATRRADRCAPSSRPLTLVRRGEMKATEALDETISRDRPSQRRAQLRSCTSIPSSHGSRPSASTSWSPAVSIPARSRACPSA